MEKYRFVKSILQSIKENDIKTIKNSEGNENMSLINEIAEHILALSQEGDVAIEFDTFSVVLGNNGLYYVGLMDKEIICMNGCDNRESCICARQFPNSYSFKTPKEVINFIELNLYDRQKNYMIMELKKKKKD